MAKNRYISTKFWDDAYVETLTIEESLFFLYCLTNESLELCGIYEFSLNIASVRTKILPEKIKQILQKFENNGKMKYLNGWLAIKNFIKYQNTENSPISNGIKRSMGMAPKELIEWVESISITTQNKNAEQDSYRSPEETYRTPPTLLNLTLPNLTLLNSKERGEEEVKIEEIKNTQEPKKPTGISFASFEEAIEKKDDMYTHMLDRFRERNKFDKFIIEREIQKFYDYWTEKRPNAKKNRQEKEDCFDVSKRLNTWFDRVTLSEKDMIEIEKAKIIRKLEQSKKLLDDQQQYE